MNRTIWHKLPYAFFFREIAVNWIGYRLGVRRLIGRGIVQNMTNSIPLDYAEKGVARRDFVRAMLTGSGTRITRKRIVEIGPGGTMLSGLMLLADGWDEYIGVDRFPSKIWSRYPQRCYDYALSQQTPDIQRLMRTAITSSRNGDGPIRYYGDVGFENLIESNLIEPHSVDVIFSWGVLEHTDDPRRVFQVSRHLLKDTGISFHVIDPGPHTWSRFSDPYLFLTIPEWLWGLMYRKRGFLNRYRASDFVQFARESGFNAAITKREQSPAGQLWLREHMLERFQSHSDEDILTQRMYLQLSADQKDSHAH